jgi:membrane-bound serine protease (ClpP class)
VLTLGPGIALAQDGGAAPLVDIVKVDGVIDGAMRDYLIGTIEEAERDGSTVVIQLDTPGTLGISAELVADRIATASVPVVVWIGPPGARAAGGGLLLLYASHLSVASPGTGIGPFLPLDLADTEAPLPEPANAPWLPSGSEARPTEPLSAQEALDRGLVDLASPSLQTFRDVLVAIDGMTITTGSGERVLATADPDAVTRFHDLGAFRRVLHALAGPSVIYALLVAGIALIAFELTQPGIGVAGVAGIAMVGAATYGLVVVPPSWPGLGLLLAGLVLLTADVRFRRLGVLTALGMAAFSAGSVLLYGGVADAIDISPWLVGAAVVGAFLYFGFGLTVAIQSRERLTSTRHGLIGLVGETRGLLAPDGPVFVKGTLWRGRAMDGPIPPGTRVRVRGLDGLVLKVEPETEGPGQIRPD